MVNLFPELVRRPEEVQVTTLNPHLNSHSERVPVEKKRTVIDRGLNPVSFELVSTPEKD